MFFCEVYFHSFRRIIPVFFCLRVFIWFQVIQGTERNVKKAISSWKVGTLYPDINFRSNNIFFTALFPLFSTERGYFLTELLITVKSPFSNHPWFVLNI